MCSSLKTTSTMLAELCDHADQCGFGKPSRCGRPERGRRAGVNGNVTLIILDKKVQGFQDPKTSRGMADLYPNVDHVLLVNGI